MFSSPRSLRPESEVPSSDPAEVAPIPLWRVAVLRGIAVAHVLAGTMELLKVAGNFLLKLPYTGGPLALPGVMTVEFARGSCRATGGGAPRCRRGMGRRPAPTLWPPGGCEASAAGPDGPDGPSSHHLPDMSQFSFHIKI